MNAPAKSQEVALTILSQLGGSGRLSAMIGAHTFTSDTNSLSFKIKARAKNGIKGIRITLDPSDTEEHLNEEEPLWT